jgi:hypothetical protein
LTISQAIINNQALAVSDESHKSAFGTSAYVIEGPTSANRLVGVNIVPGPIEEEDSYRCKLAGLIGIVSVTNAICLLHQFNSGSITVARDNKASLFIFEPDFVPEPTHQSFNLINSLANLVQCSPITWRAEHVRGHQIDKKARELLTRTKRLNHEMDSLANAFWNTLLASGHSMVPPILPVKHEG